MNTYKLDFETYCRLIYKELHKNYKIANIHELNEINKLAKDLFSKINIDRNTQIYTPKRPRFTLKDHTIDFNQNPTIRLIAPSISDIALVSKKILDRILPDIRVKTEHKLWISSDEILVWYGGVVDKKESKFIMFDIDAYYPSISPNLLDKALEMAKGITNITRL